MVLTPDDLTLRTVQILILLVLWVTLGVFILGFSSILTGTNFITTIHKLRAPGISWDRLPLNVWALYATSIIQVLATPVLAITILLLAMENILDIGIFDPALGGDPVLYQHFFWFYSHPAVYIMITWFWIISEVIIQNNFWYHHCSSSWPLPSLASVWGHHMFSVRCSGYDNFSFLTFLVGIPTGIKIFNCSHTVSGSIS